MPSCNLAESMHNKWNQQSNNRGSDLYIITVDDFIRALMQVVRYYQYLMGDRVGTMVVTRAITDGQTDGRTVGRWPQGRP
jgi:hypothetical protein